jgi:hypothetical protein
LDQEFNSLDAQYDAASAYIKSQAHAGWALIRSCREVQQSSLGKLIGVLRKEATAFGMRFQKVRVHGNTPTQQHI